MSRNTPQREAKRRRQVHARALRAARHDLTESDWFIIRRALETVIRNASAQDQPAVASVSGRVLAKINAASPPPTSEIIGNPPPIAPSEKLQAVADMPHDRDLVVYGARCGWWDSINEVATTPTGLPVCPHCGSSLFESTYGEWIASATRYEADGHPGYVDFLERNRGVHYATPEDFRAAAP